MMTSMIYYFTTDRDERLGAEMDKNFRSARRTHKKYFHLPARPTEP